MLPRFFACRLAMKTFLLRFLSSTTFGRLSNEKSHWWAYWARLKCGFSATTLKGFFFSCISFPPPNLGSTCCHRQSHLSKRTKINTWGQRECFSCRLFIVLSVVVVVVVVVAVLVVVVATTEPQE